MAMQHYTGGCHCGAVRYEVDADLDSSMTCNCSICSKTGWVLTFVPADQFKLTSGEANLTDYQFNKKLIHHFFCKTCGVRSFGRGSDGKGNESVAVNVRCLDGVDTHGMKMSHYDGKSL
jgi:hypothetical protein